MEKYGVSEVGNKKDLEKAAAHGCPRCGSEVARHGVTLLCPKCGTEPFEDDKKR